MVASAAAVVMAVLGLAIGSTFVRASNQDIVCKIARNFDPASKVSQRIDLIGKD